MEHTIVQAEGPEHAQIMLVGECPGATEEKQGKPFCGMAGKVLDGILQEVGLCRAQVRITNVVQRRPAGNNFGVFYEKVGTKKQPTAELLEAYERLKNEVVSCQPNVVVAMGAEALKALTGLDGIMLWRGSVLETPLGKVIPTVHPAAILRQWQFRPASVSDFKKVVEESVSPEFKRYEHTLIINPTFEEVLHEIEEARKAEWCAFDIEVESEQITCIGLSYALGRAVCIPFWFGASGSLWSADKESAIWGALRELLESDEPKKVAHNGSYDMEYLEHTVGIKPKLHLDTMLAFHVLYPELPKGLDYLTSVYTRHPYYKYKRKTGDMDTYWRYNATDASLTYDIARQLEAELEDSGLRCFYDEYVHPLIEPLLCMQKRGVRFDGEKKNRVRAEYRVKLEQLRKELEAAVGHELNTASNKQMTEWLYGELKLPKKYKKRDDEVETLTADEEALEELYAQTGNDALRIILEIRQLTKIYTTYLGVKLDEDKRIRCSYLITGTETGRLSSRATSRGTGTNLQNIPAGVVKELFLPDDGKVFINADLSQAEARVVAYLAGEERLIRIFEDGGDIHRRNAAVVFRKGEEEVTAEERQLAKRVIHASNYGMGPRTFAKTAGISEAEAKKLLNQYFATYPRIKVWHMAIQSKLRSSRVLTTPLGRRRIFFNRWGESVWKEGLAFIPQSTVADIVNKALVCLHSKGVELLLQVHDSVLVQCEDNPEVVERTIRTLRECMSVPVEINGRFLTIPVDFKVGYNWEEMKKWEGAGSTHPQPKKSLT